MAYGRRFKRRKLGRRRFKRFGKRRFFRGRGRRTRGRPSIAKQTRIIKDATIVKLVFVQPFAQSLNTSTGTADWYIRGNSVYDPQYTLGGAQPTGFDQWSQFYNNYKVYGSRAEISARTTDAGGYNDVLLMTLTPQLAISANSWDDAIENPYCKLKMLPNVYSGWPFKMKNYMSTAKLFGISSKRDFSDAAFAATTSNNPANEWYWQFKVSTTLGTPTTDTVDISGYLKITYYVKFFGRKLLVDT